MGRDARHGLPVRFCRSEPRRDEQLRAPEVHGEVRHLPSGRDHEVHGVEAEAELEMSFIRDLKVSVKLSRLRNLKNLNRIKFTEGEIRFRPDEYNKILIIKKDGVGTFSESPVKHSQNKFFEIMMDDFLNSISVGKSTFIDTKDVLPSIKLIDQCYSNQKRFELPWL